MNKYMYQEGLEIVQNAPQLYLDLDVEADGKAGFGSLLSVGAVSPWGDEFYRELKPTSDIWVPRQRQFCEDHNLKRERLLDEGVHPDEAMRELTEWTLEQQARYKKAGSVLTAFNASFDFPWIDLQMLQANLKSPFGDAGYCIKSRALDIAKNYDWRETSKGRLPSNIVPDGDFTHHALEDAKYQQKIHFALVGAIAAKQQMELDPPPIMKRDDTLGYHIGGWTENGKYVEGVFVCGRCSNGRGCMESSTLYLTNEEAASFDLKAYDLTEKIRNLQWDLIQHRRDQK